MPRWPPRFCFTPLDSSLFDPHDPWSDDLLLPVADASRHDLTLAFVLSENLRFKDPELRSRLLPGARGEPRFPRDLGQEPLAVESPFGRDLRKKQPASSSRLDDEAVAADHHVLRSLQTDGSGQHRDFDRAVGELCLGKRRKPRVLESGPHREPWHSPRQVSLGGERSDAAAKVPAPPERDEERTGLAERFGPVGSEPGKRLPSKAGFERPTRQG